MKKFLISFLLAAQIMIPTEIFAAGFETPHEFSAGDTISADMMNEIFDYIKKSKTPLDYDSLEGIWSCEKFTFGTNFSGTVDAYTNNNGWYVRNGVITTFTKNNDGTMSWSSSDYNTFHIYGATDSDHCNGSGTVAIYKNLVGVIINQCSGSSVGGNSNDYNRIYTIVKTSKNVYNWTGHDTTCSSGVCLSCARQNIAPNTPSSLTYSLAGKTVSLTWTDNSPDETGFKVLRRDSITGSYNTITTTSADATSYSDTVTAAGSYWYRVSSTNSNGDSVASKMIKVDVE